MRETVTKWSPSTGKIVFEPQLIIKNHKNTPTVCVTEQHPGLCSGGATSTWATCLEPLPVILGNIMKGYAGKAQINRF